MNKTKKMVLVDPPNVNNSPYSGSVNLGILYLISSLRKEIPGLEIHYINSLYTFEQHLEIVNEIQPSIYGISFSSPFMLISYKIIEEIKSRYPHMFIICGGAHPTADPIGVLENSRADICSIGEGEKTLVNIVKNYFLHSNVSKIPGTAHKNGNPDICINPKRPVIENLDELPIPAWDIVDFSEYAGVRRSRGKGECAAVSASRGCPYDCTFCSNPVWKLQKPWIRMRNPQSIAKEVDYLYNRGIREIYIRSDEMNPNLKWCISVFEALEALNHKDLFFQCNLTARPVTKELVEALKKANVWLIHIGVESCNQRVLDGIGKRFTLEEVESACRLLKNANIKVYAFMMLYQAWEKNGELKVETTREVLNSLRFCLKFLIKGLFDHISWAFATPYPGSGLYKVALKYNLLREKAKESDIIMTQEITLKLPGISKVEMLFSRSMGLLIQAIFLLTSKEFYTRESIKNNLIMIFKKLIYLIRPW